MNGFKLLKTFINADRLFCFQPAVGTLQPFLIGYIIHIKTEVFMLISINSKNKYRIFADITTNKYVYDRKRTVYETNPALY